ncbi:MAG: CoA-acylating methylmalonate-semialdehyde dehydrogenase [Myxococcota bacterium]|nr:CoA-acylating methylmalonate-semialdehyde dehydrogenase [Myxococcota bacterium]
MSQIQIPQKAIDCRNFIGGRWQKAQGAEVSVLSPVNGAVIGHLNNSTPNDVHQALEAATAAFPAWSARPIKTRSEVMFKLREILLRDKEAIAHHISAESGKTFAESIAGILKGVEVLEFAISLQNIDLGGRMEVSTGVRCEYRREPLGVVAGITPFNFPAMVPMWMLPISITLGNCFIWKPSEKTPLTSLAIGKAFQEAGLPDGVLNIVQGDASAAQEILTANGIKAVGFVGSTAVAQKVYTLGTAHQKRVLALGGAKNHIILMPDADPNITIDGIVQSFTGCAGQRCMAASVLLAVGEIDGLLNQIADKAASMELGKDMGAIITSESLERLEGAIGRAESDGATIRVDGRKPHIAAEQEAGFWLAPTIIDNAKPQQHAAQSELFGPVLTVIRCKNLKEAIQIENQNPYGNAASVFTTSGAVAELVTHHAKAGMVGVNVGVPVPREPFSFGGINDSKFGHGDITGHGSLDFWTNQKKVTTKWGNNHDKTWMS